MKIKKTKRLKYILKHKLLGNGLWLYTLQLFNTLVPLLTLPYVTRVLGPENYGVFSAALNLVTYFQVTVEYGFNLSGTRKVALASDQMEISNIYSRILSSKLFLALISFALMLGLSLFLEMEDIQFKVMLILYIIVIGTSLQQTWLFQGLEDMKLITISNVISRTLSVILIFIFVNNSDHIVLYSFLYSLTYLLIGLINIYIVKSKYSMKLNRVSINSMFEELKDGWYLFTTSAMGKVFSGFGVTILVFSSSAFEVGVYSAIYKIPQILKMLYEPIGQVIYPYISRLYTESFSKGYAKIKSIINYIIIVFGSISILLVINSRYIVNVLYGSEYVNYSYLLIPLIIWTILSITNNLLGVQVLVASGHLKEYSIAFRIGVVAIVFLNILFGIKYGSLGISIAAALAELVLTISILLQIIKIKKEEFNE